MRVFYRVVQVGDDDGFFAVGSCQRRHRIEVKCVRVITVCLRSVSGNGKCAGVVLHSVLSCSTTNGLRSAAGNNKADRESCFAASICQNRYGRAVGCMTLLGCLVPVNRLMVPSESQ